MLGIWSLNQPARKVQRTKREIFWYRKNGKNDNKEKNKDIRKCYKCHKAGHKEYECKNNVDEPEKLGEMEKAEKALDEGTWSSVQSWKKTTNTRKKEVWFTADINLPSPHTTLLPTQEVGIMCIIDGNSFYAFTMNTLIGDTGSSCHVTNNDTDMFDKK